MATSVHNIAQKGFGTGTNELYDKARPSYQPHALTHIRESIQSPGPLNIVEVGAGTGIFTRALLAAPQWSSSLKELKAIEPSEGMRDQFSKTINDKRVSVAAGTFNHIDVEDGWADAVIIAQAFHWCSDYNGAMAEFGRVLKPGGVVAFVWNLEDRNQARWTAQLRDRIEQHEGGSPQFRLGLWRAAFETPNYPRFFQPQEERQWPYSIPSTVDLAINRAFSKSYIAILPSDQQAQVKADVQAILERGDDMVWSDKDQGIFEYPYKTYIVISRKK